MTEFEWTPEMGEISGFGGSYEDGCRAMVEAGVKWLRANPDADPKFRGFKNVFGLAIDHNEDAEAMSQAMLDAPITDPDTGEETTCGKYGATGAMHHAAIQHALVLNEHGWEWYAREMSARWPEPEDEP